DRKENLSSPCDFRRRNLQTSPRNRICAEHPCFRILLLEEALKLATAQIVRIGQSGSKQNVQESMGVGSRERMMEAGGQLEWQFQRDAFANEFRKGGGVRRCFATRAKLGVDPPGLVQFPKLLEQARRGTQ